MEVNAKATAAGYEADLQEVSACLRLSKRRRVQQELERVRSEVLGELTQVKAGWVSEGATVAPPTAAEAPAPIAAPAAAAVDTSGGPPQELAPKTPTPPAPAEAAAAHKAAPTPVPIAIKSAGPWTEITQFTQDLGGYEKPHVTVDLKLTGVANLPPENVTCDFTEASFDLKVVGLHGHNYRFVKRNLHKDIVPAESQFQVNGNHIVITLQKVKGYTGYDSWMDLCANGGRKSTGAEIGNSPQDRILAMMRDLYEDGDDNMKRVLVEAMHKALTGEFVGGG